MPAPTEIVATFCGQWDESIERTRAAVREYFRPDTVWDNVGWSVTTGPDEAIAFWDDFVERGFALIRVEMLHIAAAGNVVLTERIDHLTGLDGEVLISARIMGVFELDDNNKIIRWADYTDPTVFASLPSPSGN